MLEFIDRFPDLQETPAQFQERCGQIALACFWKDDEKAPAVPRNRMLIKAAGWNERDGWYWSAN